MKDKLKKYLKETIVFVVILLIAINVFSYYRSLDLNKEKLDLKTVVLLDDSIYKVSENKPILLHFWATWCPICKLEASSIEKLSKEYEVISFAVQSGSNEEIKEYLEENNLSFKVVNDENAYYSNKFNISAFPTTFIYDSKKDLRFSEVGYTSILGFYSRMALIE